MPEERVSVKLLFHTQTPVVYRRELQLAQVGFTHHSRDVERGPSPGSQGAESEGRWGATSSTSNDITKSPLPLATSSRRLIRWFVEWEASERLLVCRWK